MTPRAQSSTVLTHQPKGNAIMATPQDTPPKSKQKRTPRPFYIAMQVLDENGVAAKFAKDQVNIVAASQNAGDILDAMESGDHPNVFYKKVTLGK